MWIVEGYSLVGLLTRLVGAHIDMHIAQQEGILILFYLLILHTLHFEGDKLLPSHIEKNKLIIFFSNFRCPGQFYNAT